MTLPAGTLIGAYEVVGSLGAGGMGEVYRARDKRLNRGVALKIVPEPFALDADRLARFLREAQVLAALNHPNIAAIYGVEDGAAGKALVLELVEGETVADRIARGPIQLNEALPLACQIAEALESAHEQGIVHRDLKPANIKVREDGTVKVLDFGLAKMLEQDTSVESSSLSLSPTITTPAMTQIGMILGTAAYMAPEQARGKPADRRSDVWAFGCVFFEMLSGIQAFAGEDVTDTIAAVVRGEPPWQKLPTDLPGPIRLLLQRCLEKDRRKRIGDISGVLFVLREPGLAAPMVAKTVEPTPKRRSWRSISVMAATLLTVGAISAAAAWLLKPRDPQRVSLLSIVTVAPIARVVPGHHLAITSDGSTIAYASTLGNVPSVHLRHLDSLETKTLVQPGTSPFFRADGKEVGYFLPLVGQLRRIPIIGGPSALIARVDGAARGATWGDNTIVFATSSTETGLMRVAPAGGEPEVLTKPPDGFDHVLPRFLPHVNAVLFTIVGTTGTGATAQVAVLDLRSTPPQIKVLIETGSDARYLSSGHLAYIADNALRVVPFDESRLEVTDATPIQLASEIATGSSLATDFDVSATGTLVHLLPGATVVATRTLARVDRSGRPTPIAAPPRAYLYPRISPDGTRVALDIRQDDNDIWVWNLRRGGFTKVTRDLNADRTPVWANNDEIIYTGLSGGVPTIYRQRADGTGVRRQIANPQPGQPLFALSIAGSRLLVNDLGGGPGAADLRVLDLAVQPAASDRASSKQLALPKSELLVQGPAGDLNGTASPDGRWLAYQSNEGGTWEIYVQPFGAGAGGGRETVSNAGGVQPRWSANGEELYYVSPRSEMMAVKVGKGATWNGSLPEKLFDADNYFFGLGTDNVFVMYDVDRNGRFLMLQSGEQPAATPQSDQIIVVQGNWLEELTRIGGR